jgi:threonine dehydrogenase-like Zn-dependent dehydrogenase
LTGGIGVDRAIDAVGVDAEAAHTGPAAREAVQHKKQFKQELDAVAPKRRRGDWEPGDAPSQALRWAVDALAKAGTLSIIGAYPPTFEAFPLGMAMNRNLTVNMGNCNHRKYVPMLLELVQNGTVHPSKILTQAEPLDSAIEAYRAFDERQPGWIKVELLPTREAAAVS